MENQHSSDLIGQRKYRLEKVAKLREIGIDPYPSVARKTHTNAQIIDEFDGLEGQEVTVIGRLDSWREHGKLIFGEIRDQSGPLQLYIKADELKETNIDNQRIGFDDLNLLDIGDFILATGIVTKTQRGEISVLPHTIKIAAKSIRPLPKEMEDKEERYRRRYVDMNIRPNIRQMFERRARFWQAHRDFLNSQGFFEVNIPILEHIPGGGDAVPFTTHMNAIHEDFYLRISHELPLKRLIGAGFDKVYDIGARFRNEGLSDEHLPEHVAMEFYWAYANWEDGMNFVQDLFNYVIKETYGGQMIFNIKDFEVEFGKEWERIDFNEIMNQHFDIGDVYSVNIETVKKLLSENQIEYEESINVPRGVDMLWKKIRKTIAGPAFLVNHPKYLSPLQKPSLENPKIVERCQPIIAGSELGNGWSELNDPVEQYERFVEQQEMRDAGDEEAQWLDIDYVEMLEYGMPPTFGWGHSERVFWFLENVTAKEGVPFPQLKFHIDDLTKELYPEIDFENLRDINTSDEAIGIISGSSSIDKVPQVNLANISEKIASSNPGVKFGYIVLENVEVGSSSKDLEELKAHVGSYAKARFSSIEELKEDENISGFRSLYKSFGSDPNSNLNSAEALLRRIILGKGLYDINNIVDTYNVTSAEFRIPMAAYDLDSVNGGIELRPASENEEIIKIGETTPTKTNGGEFVYADESGVICLDYNYRDSDRTKITENTKKMIVFVDGHESISKEYIKGVLAKAAERFIKFANAKVVGKGFSWNEQSSIRKGFIFSEDNQDFENRIAVVVNKELETWQIANAIAHISAYLGHKLDERFATGENFVSSDGVNHPRNTQYPIVIFGAKPGQMTNFMKDVRGSGNLYHGFIKEMIDTTNDKEITEILKSKPDDEIQYLGIGVFGKNKDLKRLTNKFSLYK